MSPHPRLRGGDVVVSAGTFPYESLRAPFWIVRTAVRPGTGDAGDTPEWRDDLPGTCFRIDCAAPGDPDRVVSTTGHFATLDDALTHAARVMPGAVFDLR